MTEYDYSPEAWERYLATQDRIARWVDGTRKQQPCNAFTPATPHLKALALKEKERQRQKASGRAYNGKFTDESEDEYCEPRRRSHRKPSRQHRTYWDDVGKDFVFVDAHDVPPPSPPPSRCRRSSFSIPVSPTSPAKSNGKPRKGPRNLTLDLAPFPTCGVPPQDPYSYRNSGHSSHSSNTTTPTTTTPTSSMFPTHQLPVPPYSAPPAMGYAPMLGGGGLPMRPERAPKPTRTQTMPVSPHYANPQAHYVHHGFMPIPVGHNTLMVPLSPGMKGYPSYGADPSAKVSKIMGRLQVSPRLSFVYEAALSAEKSVHQSYLAEDTLHTTTSILSSTVPSNDAAASVPDVPFKT
ncbi:hypothetical protein CC1G_03892 [Coprinopsis cinerea okayama7|uniref:Uncharacterized protein n=1 Tax=Coprinopsis cinerea (strain Okayama-7 / 130 / ATCC MYA-4618 / FGSC 9003) TaxID=240176 RepID=A8NH42_COPC7|nr:hypothetical protein CC1G_03892 [Coprinopsis cinerea okayama7\|eukprot:XP_001833675.2 hypothetical protein CC1G_03892 [Coprinopsis cinerea okayama7\